jgi:hypothetical protein
MGVSIARAVGTGRRRLRHYVHGRQDGRGCALGRGDSLAPARQPSITGGAKEEP